MPENGQPKKERKLAITSWKNFGVSITVHISTEFYLFINISRHMILLYLSSIIWNKMNTAKILLKNTVYPRFSSRNFQNDILLILIMTIYDS